MDSYWSDLWSRAWWDSWGLVFTQPIPAIFVGILAFGFPLLLRRKREGKAFVLGELKDYFWGTAGLIVAFVVVLIVQLLVFAPKRLLDDERMKTKNFEVMQRSLEDRMANVHTQDPAYQTLMAAIHAFMEMRKIESQKDRCLILITDHGGRGKAVSDTLMLGSGVAGCASGGFNGTSDSDTPDSREAIKKDYSDVHVVIHSRKGDMAAYVLAENIGTLTFVQKSWIELPWTPPGVIWIQVGGNVEWYKRN